MLAGLVAMHGLSGTALAGPKHLAMPAAVLSMDMAAGQGAHGSPPAGPAPNDPHHGPTASGHHPCLAAPAASVDLVAPADMVAPARRLVQQAATFAPARARADRAPPDPTDLCVSRT